MFTCECCGLPWQARLLHKRLISPALALHMQAYTVSLSGAFAATPSIKSTVTRTLTAEGSPLLVSISGPSGLLAAARTITLSAEDSLDPDDPTNALAPLTYTWACEAASGGACFKGSYTGVQVRPSFVLGGAQRAPVVRS